MQDACHNTLSKYDLTHQESPISSVVRASNQCMEVHGFDSNSDSFFAPCQRHSKYSIFSHEKGVPRNSFNRNQTHELLSPAEANTMIWPYPFDGSMTVAPVYSSPASALCAGSSKSCFLDYRKKKTLDFRAQHLKSKTWIRNT